MNSSTQNLDALKDIKKMMERSSRFISLSGWSGIVAGLCALAGAVAGWCRINLYQRNLSDLNITCPDCLRNDLIIIAAIVFTAAFATATFFTYLKSKKEGVDIWGVTARRLMWNTLLPMLTGGCILLRMLQLKEYGLIAPGCLLFYGLALVNGSKYTMGEVRYLGYAEILLGIVTLWLDHQGLVCWAIGFGVFHIIYGVAMWWKYDRQGSERSPEISK